MSDEKQQKKLEMDIKKLGENFGFNLVPQEELTVAKDGKIIYRQGFEDYMQVGIYIRRTAPK